MMNSDTLKSNQGLSHEELLLKDHPDFGYLNN